MTETAETRTDLEQRPVLVVDYGAQYAQLIARRVREASVYSEIVPHTWSTEQILAKNPAAIILSGGPSSVYAEDAPQQDAALFEAGVPVLGICYGFQAMAQALGGTVALCSEQLSTAARMSTFTALERVRDTHLLDLLTKTRAVSPLRHVPGDLVAFRGGQHQLRSEVSQQLDALFAAKK